MKWSKELPENFYFYVGATLDGVCAVICPASFFDEYGCVFDQYLQIESLLPDILTENIECMFDSIESVEETRKVLLKRNFTENKEFNRFCASIFEPLYSNGTDVPDLETASDINWLSSPLTKEEQAIIDHADDEQGKPW